MCTVQWMFPVPVLQDQRNAAGDQGQVREEVHHLHGELTGIDIFNNVH